LLPQVGLESTRALQGLAAADTVVYLSHE
jgi:hypothetical protein